MLVPLFAAIAPFIIWPIEIFFPYPHIVEELTKGLLVFLLLRSFSSTSKISGTFLIGFLFAISETVLYLFNILPSGNPQTLLLRLTLTMPMHIITTYVIFTFASIDKRLIFLGIIIAVFIHYFFNVYVPLIKI